MKRRPRPLAGGASFFAPGSGVPQGRHPAERQEDEGIKRLAAAWEDVPAVCRPHVNRSFCRGPGMKGTSQSLGSGRTDKKAAVNRKLAYSGWLGTPDQTLTGGLPLRSTAYHFANCSYHIFPCCFFANCASWRQVNLHKFP